jgi:hypothetical protein
MLKNYERIPRTILPELDLFFMEAPIDDHELIFKYSKKLNTLEIILCVTWNTFDSKRILTKTAHIISLEESERIHEIYFEQYCNSIVKNLYKEIYNTICSKETRFLFDTVELSVRLEEIILYMKKMIT